MKKKIKLCEKALSKIVKFLIEWDVWNKGEKNKMAFYLKKSWKKLLIVKDFQKMSLKKNFLEIYSV